MRVNENMSKQTCNKICIFWDPSAKLVSFGGRLLFMLACWLVGKSGDALGQQHLPPLKKEMLLMLAGWLRMESGKAFGHHYLLRLGKFVFHARWLAGGEVWGRRGPATSSSLEEEDVIAAGWLVEGLDLGRRLIILTFFLFECLLFMLAG